MASAKLSSSPAIFSATATAISLADLVTMSLMAFSTAIVDPRRIPSFVGAVAGACLSGVGSRQRRQDQSRARQQTSDVRPIDVTRHHRSVLDPTLAKVGQEAA